MQQRGCRADPAAGLYRPDGCRRDLERDGLIDRTGLYRFAGRAGAGGAQSAGCAGLRQRPTVDQKCVQRRPHSADVGGRGRLGKRRREGKCDIAVEADAHSARMIDR